MRVVSRLGKLCLMGWAQNGSLLPSVHRTGLSGCGPFCVGRLPSLTLVLPDSAAPDDTRLVLRLWDANLELADGNPMPVWIGSVVEEHVLRPLSLVSGVSSRADADRPRDVLAQMLRSGRVAMRPDAETNAEWDGGVLLLNSIDRMLPD